MVCKGVCEKYRFKRLYPKDHGYGYYRQGAKRCQVCTIWIMRDGVNCPCCGSRLRMYPRSPKLRIRLGMNKVVRY